MHTHALTTAIQHRLMKEQVYVPDTHSTVTKAVRATEYALANGMSFKIAVAFGVSRVLRPNDNTSRKLINA